jgi:hypothetical protein
MRGLSPYDRATVGLWRRGRERLAAQPDRALAEVAAHAVLARLRRCREPRALLAAYEADAADFRLIGSLLAGDEASELFWCVRDAAFGLRWRELGGDP